jgi:high affinity Mn2+ porin
MLKFSRQGGFALLLLLGLLPAAQQCRAEPSENTVALSENWSVHGQSTLVWQGYPDFSAAFTGPNSLAPQSQIRETSDATLFLGVRLIDGLAFYTDPEFDQGFGLSDTLGAAGFTSGEAYKVGEHSPYFKLPRAYFRYVSNLGGDTVNDSAGANQLAGTHRADNLTFTVGKFGVPDVFDTNKYAHDPRGDFLNWSIIESGGFDYAADAWGFTYGAAAEWTQSWWSLRAGVFDLSRVPNSPHLVRGLGQYAAVTEGEERHELWKQPGTVKLLLFANRANMGSYDAAVALAQQSGGVPDTALVRRYATRPGGDINVQQQINADLGLFLRASLNDGSKEAYDFTDINRSLSAGVSLQGARWKRANDTVGFAGVINGIASPARQYLAAGGLGILIGDGALPRYGSEKILETYYSLYIAEWANLSLDYQFVDNPAYNPLRGPVSVFAVRAHVEF